MSDTENLFLQEMRKVLYRAVIPVVAAVILGIGSFAIAAPFRIKAIEEKTNAIKDNYVTNAMMVLYYEEFRRANDAMTKWQETHDDKHLVEFSRIHERMDEMIKEMIPHNTRSASTIKPK